MASVTASQDTPYKDEDVESRIAALISKIIAITSTPINVELTETNDNQTSINNVSELHELQSLVTNCVIGQLRECTISPDSVLNDEDLIVLEIFFAKYLPQIFSSTVSARVTLITSNNSLLDERYKSTDNWSWLTTMVDELHFIFSTSLFLLSKSKHMLLIPMITSFQSLIFSPSTSLLYTSDVSLKNLVSSYRKLLILLVSFSFTPHEVQVFFNQFTDTDSPVNLVMKTPVHSVVSPSKSSNCTPVKSISAALPSVIVPANSNSTSHSSHLIDSTGDNNSNVSCTTSTINAIDSQTHETGCRENYYSLLPAALTHSLVSSLPGSCFAFTAFSSLSLPPVKSFPLRSFSISTHIRLESLSNHFKANNGAASAGGPAFSSSNAHFTQRQSSTGSGSSSILVHHQLSKQIPLQDQRMFLFSFKTSSQPPIGFSGFFSHPSAAATAGNTNVNSDNGASYVKLTVSCFKGSSSPSLSHTLSYPFSLVQGDNVSSSNQFLHLTLTFSATALSLYVNGELIESNGNDWSISSVKAPYPSFDRCFIGCPYSPLQSKTSNSIGNPNDTGFTGQLTSIYIFSSALSPPAVNLLSTLDPSNHHCNLFVNSSGLISGTSSPSGHCANNYLPASSSVPESPVVGIVTSNCGGKNNCNTGDRSNLSSLVKEKEKLMKEINCNLVCLYSPMRMNWPIVLQLINNSTVVTQLTSHALIQGNLQVINRSLVHDSLESLGQGIDVILNLLIDCIRTSRCNDFNQLLSFAFLLFINNRNDYFLQSALTCNFLGQILFQLNSLPSQLEKVKFISFPSTFLKCCTTLLQSLMQDTKVLHKIFDEQGYTSYKQQFSVVNGKCPAGGHGDGDFYSLPDPSAVDKVKQARCECVKQLLELFIFNSHLWSDLLPPNVFADSVCVSRTPDDRCELYYEETITSLFSFISSNLLYSSNHLSPLSLGSLLLRRRRRSALVLQVFDALKNQYYHNKYPFFDRNSESEDGEFNRAKQMYDRRERFVSLIRSNLLVFVKSLLTKASQNRSTNGTVNSGVTANAGTTNGSSATGNNNTGDAADESHQSEKRNSNATRLNHSHDQLIDGATNNGNTTADGDCEHVYDEEMNCILNYLSYTSTELLQRENIHSKSLLNLIDVLSLLNSLLIEIPSTTIPAFDSRKGIHVLFQIVSNTIRCESDTANTGRTFATNAGKKCREEIDCEAEEKEVIRSLCLKILGSFLTRSTYKRKSAAMTPSHFSILYYMLCRDQSILSHSLYVNLMEITIEAPISSLHSIQSTSNCNRNAGNNRRASGDDFYWNDGCDSDYGIDKEERSGSCGSSGKESSNGTTIKIENPHMIKVIALLVVKHKNLADTFLKDLYTLLMDSRSNRRLILQMSVWQSWLIAFLKIDSSSEKEYRKREQTVISLFKLLLYHALRWEFGGWRVWIDSLAIIHSFLSREAFNRTYANFESEIRHQQQSHIMKSDSRSNLPSNVATAAAAAAGQRNSGKKAPHEILNNSSEECSKTHESSENTDCKSNLPSHVTSRSSSDASMKKRLPTPTYRIPAFRWSSIHIQLLDSLISAIISDVNCFRKDALMRANLNGSPNLDMRDNDKDNNESIILDTILFSSEIYVINIIHLISQLTDSTILDAGGLLPLLALATSSSSNSSSSNVQNNTVNQCGNGQSSSSPHTGNHKTPNSAPSPSVPQVNKQRSLTGPSVTDDDKVDLMNENTATELLFQLVFLTDYLIFGSTLTATSSNVIAASASTLGVSLAELEAEKNMSSGGLLRQVLRLVSMVAVKRVLSLRERSSTSGSRKNTAPRVTSETPTTVGETPVAEETNDATTVTKDAPDHENSEMESISLKDDDPCSVSDDDDDTEESHASGKTSGVNALSDAVNSPRRNAPQAEGDASNLNTSNTSGYCSIRDIIHEEDADDDHLLLSIRDIQRLRATLYRTDPSSTSETSTGKDRTNSNFLALATMYFLSVLLVSKYRDTLDVVSSAKNRSSSTSENSTAESNNDSNCNGSGKNNDCDNDLSSMERSLQPTVQFLKEIISDFESFLSKSLLGSKGQTLLTKNLVKRIKSNDCSPLEVVMLLCAQEFQNSLQKNAGLAFIELINEGRLLSISMKEHVIRVGIEADFILTRIDRDEKERDALFKRDSMLIEEKREKEVELVQEVIQSICSCVAYTAQPSTPDANGKTSMKGKENRKRKVYRDLEEFLLDKKIVLFRDLDDLKDNDSKYAPINPNVSSTASANFSRTVSHSTTTGHIEAVSHCANEERAKPATVSSACQTNVEANHGTNMRALPRIDTPEVMALREEVKRLMDTMRILKKERDEAIDELQCMKQFVQCKSSPVKAVDDVIEEHGHGGTLELTQVSPEPEDEAVVTDEIITIPVEVKENLCLEETDTQVEIAVECNATVESNPAVETVTSAGSTNSSPKRGEQVKLNDATPAGELIIEGANEICTDDTSVKEKDAAPAASENNHEEIAQKEIAKDDITKDEINVRDE